jgi:hypothetical protein
MSLIRALLRVKKLAVFFGLAFLAFPQRVSVAPRTRVRLVLAIGSLAVAASATAACGGSPNTPNGSFVGSPGGSDPPPTKLVSVRLTVTIPAGGARPGIGPDYVSSATQSLAIQLASVNGAGVTGVNATTLDTLLKSPNCGVHGASTVCAATISGSPGSDVFSVTTYDGLNATGFVLSVGSVTAQIGSGGGGVGISSRLSLDVNGVIASLKLALSPNNAKRGMPMQSAVTLAAFDAAGAQIVGGSNYQTPIAVTIQGDATGSFTLHAPGQSGPSLSIVKPTSGLSLRYNGNKQASSITIQAGVNNVGSVNAPFTLHGHAPPPPVGTIYALNLGSNDGRSATVTEYDGKANGNAAPLRTLNLSTKLYARSINVDAAGNLYVGYFDNSLGFSPSNGSPDQGNVVAIFAPGASGNAQPAAVLTADSGSQTALFPLYTVIDAAGGLVAYGATAVDGNAGNNAVLTYAAGASGPAAPVHGWDFVNPVLRYAGPTGLTLDSAGNFYVAGALHTFLGPSYGIFVASAADIGNPQANPARTIPWDATTELAPGFTVNVGLDSSGEVVVANTLLTVNGSNISCQGRANVFAAGASGGTTDVPPLRVVTLQGVFTQNSQCASPRSPLQPFFPTLALYGNTAFVVDDFNNALDAFPTGSGGTVSPTQHIAGPATGLNAPIAVFASPLSGQAPASPVTGRSFSAPTYARTKPTRHTFDKDDTQ